MSEKYECVSDCTGNLFTRECIHFTFMMLLSTGLVLFAMLMLALKTGLQSCDTGYFFGIISTVLSFWATPPKIPKTAPSPSTKSKSVELEAAVSP